MYTKNEITVSDSLVVSGPQSYMNERFPILKSKIESGQCYVFNYSLKLGNPIKLALLVAVQTDFAGWKGTKELLGNF